VSTGGGHDLNKAEWAKRDDPCGLHRPDVPSERVQKSMSGPDPTGGKRFAGEQTQRMMQG